MAKAIDRASLIVGALVAFIVAGIGNFFYLGDLAGDMDRESQVLCAVTERFMVERPGTWEFGSDRLRARLEPYISGKLSYRVVTLSGDVVAEIQRSPGSRLISKRKDIRLFGQPVGYVEAGIGLWTPVLLSSGVCVFGLGLGALLAGILRKRPLGVLRDAGNAIVQAQSRLQQMNDRLESIREDERKHLARELHDEIGQQLTGMKFEIVGALKSAGYENEQKRFGSMFDRAVQTVRKISWQLRPPVLDMLGLEAAISSLGKDYQQRAATRCHVVVPEHPLGIDGDLATNLYRMCQELLTNIQRHARASRVEITLTGGAEVVLTVADDGTGIDPEAIDGMSLGLLGIRERARRIGATLDIRTRPEFDGTCVTIKVPGVPKPGGKLDVSARPTDAPRGPA